MRLRNIPNANDIINNSDYVIKFPENQKGKWVEVFENHNKIEVEIGSGKGDFLIGMAKKFPNTNFIGIEKFSSVLVRGLYKLEDEVIPNLKFILFDAKNLELIFINEEVSNIYLNFSDPWPKSKHTKRRLTSLNFINIYNKILKKEGRIIQKTDNVELFNYSLETMKDANWDIDYISRDLHRDDISNNNVMTEYEKRFSKQGIKINYAIYKKKF